MKPERHSKTLLGVTRSKAKMYEFGVPMDDHIAIPKDPARLFPLALGMLGELAFEINQVELAKLNGSETRSIAKFAAHFIDAYRNGRFREEHGDYYSILAGAAYYLSEVPGSAQVLVTQLNDGYPQLACEGLESLLITLMRAVRTEISDELFDGAYKREILAVTGGFEAFVSEGFDVAKLMVRCDRLRMAVYASGTARQLLVADLACAVARMKVRYSARYCLPLMTGLAVEKWEPILKRPTFMRELWPAQRLLGEQQVFAGRSAVIQMPTSAGKTRAVEIIIRSAFLTGRSRLAVIVAPFRALCHEISQHLAEVFADDGVDVNEPSDVMQVDFDFEFGEKQRAILVATPEKLLYITRHEPELAAQMGLVIYDEGHQFDSGIRGVTYELLLTSLKETIPSEAQVVLISAVIGNGEDIRKWLIGDRGAVVNGVTLSPTTRSIAFSSFMRGAGQLQFVAEGNPQQDEFFVPKVLASRALEPVKGDQTGVFPMRTDGKDIALSLGSRLVPQGSVAIFCGRKDAVPSLCERALEVHARGIESIDVSQHSSADELVRLAHLYAAHYGAESIPFKAARLGLLTHHRNVPEGLRIAVEYAMRERLASFVICTSTLAQGVNLPIRYLLVTSVYQGRERMKTRDFQNLMGRVGRSGMFTEGSVIFTDPDIYGLRHTREDGWRFQGVAELLRADGVQPCESSLLAVLHPVFNTRKNVHITVKTAQLAKLYLDDKAQLAGAAAKIVELHKEKGFELSDTKRQIDQKVAIFGAIESYLLAHWDETDEGLSKKEIGALAKRTFAYSIAKDAEKKELLELFELLGVNVAEKVNEPEKRRVFGRSLYGVADVLRIEQWVRENLAALVACDGSAALLGCIWPILRECIANGNFRKAETDERLREIAEGWIKGQPYHILFAQAVAGKMIFRTPKQKRKVTLEHVIDICENGLAYDGALCAGALVELVELIAPGEVDLIRDLKLLQKRLRYGVETRRAIRIHEAGFADRIIAAEMAHALGEGRLRGTIEISLRDAEEAMRNVLNKYPTYFDTVLDAIVE